MHPVLENDSELRLPQILEIPFYEMSRIKLFRRRLLTCFFSHSEIRLIYLVMRFLSVVKVTLNRATVNFGIQEATFKKRHLRMRKI